MRQLPQAVLIVTSKFEEEYYGLTISSATSVSLDPPLFLICIDRKAPSLIPILKGGTFVVNLLNEQQMNLSDQFAGRFKDRDKFRNVQFRFSEKGLPIIEDIIGYLECQIWKNFGAGDHEIIIGEVLGGEMKPGSPIVYYNQSYSKVGSWESGSEVYPPF